MKLFVWNYEWYYSGGIVAVMARSSKEARQKAIAQIGEASAMIDLVKNQEPIISLSGVVEVFWAE